MKTLLKRGQKFELFWRREYSLFQGTSINSRFVETINTLLGIKTAVRFEIKDKWMFFYSTRKHVKGLTNYYVKLIEKRRPFLKKEFQELNRTGRAWLSGTKKIVSESQKPNADLSGLLKRFWDFWDEHIISLWKTFVIAEAGSIVFTKMLARYVSPEFQAEAIANYTRPSKRAHLLRLTEDLAKKRGLNQKIQYVKKHYPWIFTTDLFSPLPTNKQYLDYVKTLKPPQPKKAKKGRKLFSKEALPILALCQDILYLKDHRDEYRRRAFFGIYPLVEKIIKRYKVTRDDLWYVFPDELWRLEKERKEILSDIAQRKKGFVFEADGKRKFWLQGKKAQKAFLKDDSRRRMRGRTIKGVAGSSGKARGVVQVLRKAQDSSLFKKGNILVSVTTNPDYIVAMQKALAFVTDEGGITSHAAIISREMKKPCVVGTKFATHILKDGDIVEVDANEGIVKRL